LWGERLAGWLRVALLSLPLLFLIVFYLYPLVAILRVSLLQEGAFSAVREIAASSSLWRVLWFTFWQAVISTALTLALGLPLAAVFARFQFPGKTLLRGLTTIPFVMPTVVVAAAFTTLLGERGVVNLWLQGGLGLAEPPVRLMNTVWIILLVHAFYNVSVVVRTVGGFWETLNPGLTEAGRLLGAHGWRLFREVTWPLLLPSLTAAGLLVFLFCFTSFGVVLILGGIRFATIEVEIYRQAVSIFNLPAAAFLCLLQMALTFVVMAVYTHVQGRASLPLEMRPRGTAARRPRTWGEWALVSLAVGFILFFLLSPLLALAWRSVTLGGEGFTLRYYQELTLNRRQSAFFVPPITAVANSLAFGGAAMTLSLLLGVSAAYLLMGRRLWLNRILDPLFLLPLGTSAVTLGFGYIVSMGAWRTALWITPVAHTLIAMPFVVRTFLPALRSLDPRLRESAAVLGAPPRRVWWEVDAPNLRGAFLVSAAFAFTISLGEFGATLLISRPDAPTMPVVIYRALGQPGVVNYGQALAMSTLLMVVCAAALALIEHFRLPDEEF
jgi:thiamine transport system permease protein